MGDFPEDEMRKGEELMSMQPRQLEPVPETTSRTARRAFPKGTLAMVLRDELDSISTDEMFADLFPETRVHCGGAVTFSGGHRPAGRLSI